MMVIKTICLAKYEIITVWSSIGKACWPLFFKPYRLKLGIIGWPWYRRREKIKTLDAHIATWKGGKVNKIGSFS